MGKLLFFVWANGVGSRVRSGVAAANGVVVGGARGRWVILLFCHCVSRVLVHLPCVTVRNRFPW